MALEDLNITENYDAFKILTEAQLNTAMQSIETYMTNNVKLNFQQIGLDVFGNTYEFNNDGNATFVTPLIDLFGKLDDDEIVTGAWTFQDTVEFEQPVSSISTFTSSGQPRAKAYRATSDQSIPNNVSTEVDLNAESYDIGGLHNTVVNSERFTIPSGAGGSYSFKAQVIFEPNATGYRQLTIFKNGTQIAQSINSAPTATENTTLSAEVDDEASVNDVYSIKVLQTSGGALDLTKNEGNTFFSCRKVW